MNAVVETRGLCKQYGPALRVNHLDLTVPEGAVYGFLGPNGAGKSTTLKLLNAYDRMGAAGVEGANIDGTMGRIDAMMDKVVEAFDKQLDALFADEALDISTDITVLEQMLAQEGLGGMQMGQS